MSVRVVDVGKTGSDFYFRRLLERWRRAEDQAQLSLEEKQALVEWDMTPAEFQAQLKREIAEAGADIEVDT